jgi:hypothetical protein
VGVNAELNGDNGSFALVERCSINVEVCDLTSFGEADPKVLRVFSSESENGVSSLERHSSSSAVLARGVTFSNGDGTRLTSASNSNFADRSVIF